MPSVLISVFDKIGIVSFAKALSNMGFEIISSGGTAKTLKETTLQIDELINSHVRKRGLIHVDGKKEFSFDEERALMVVDTFGTPDEDRFWDLAEFERGNHVEKSKEFVRVYYRESGYHEALYDARDKGLPEPDIPPLPKDKIEETSRIYIQLFEQLTGEKFR